MKPNPPPRTPRASQQARARQTAWRWALAAPTALTLVLGLVLWMTAAPDPTSSSRTPDAARTAQIRDGTRPQSATASPLVLETKSSSADAAGEFDGSRALRAALGSPNEGVRIDAVRAAASEGRTALLPVLESQSLAQDPALAPSLIRAIGDLAGHATPSERERAASTLARWLDEES